LGRLRLWGCAFGLAVLTLASAAAQDTGGRDFISSEDLAPAKPRPPTLRAIEERVLRRSRRRAAAAGPIDDQGRAQAVLQKLREWSVLIGNLGAPVPAAVPARAAAEPAQAQGEPARPSSPRTRSARPRLQTPRQISKPATAPRASTAARPAKSKLAARPPVRRARIAPATAAAQPPASTQPAARPTPVARPTLARRPISPTPNPPTATDRPAPSAEARPPAPEPPPGPRLAFAAGGSEGLHRELTETLRGADPRFRLVGTAGGQRSLNELLEPSGADLAVTSTVALGRAAPDAKARIAFVAKLFAEEIHVLARDGTGRLDDLDGKPVAVGPPGSAAEIAARDLFAAVGTKPVLVTAAGTEALARLRSGEVAAVVTLSGRPAAELAGIGPIEGLHLLPVPFAAGLQAEYYPASLPASAYPGLIAEGERIDTIAVGAVLVASAEGGDRPRRAAALAESIFGALPELARSGHPKWREVNLGALLPDWPRFEPARRWLAAHPPPPPPRPPVSSPPPEEAAR